jgi:hypothetical protein
MDMVKQVFETYSQLFLQQVCPATLRRPGAVGKTHGTD